MTDNRPRRNYSSREEATSPLDDCQTPPYALDPLIPYLDPGWTIWEPCAGDGYLVRALQTRGFRVIASDIKTGQDIFRWQPSEPWNCIITNPPYSRYAKYPIIQRCYEFGKPLALLMQTETLGVGAAIRIFRRYSMQLLQPDKRINFKMPVKGLKSSGAQWPVAWFTWQLLPCDIVYCTIRRRPFLQVLPSAEFAFEAV